MRGCRKIVVTGALGHIGSRMIRDLPQVYPDSLVVMIDNMLTQRYCSLFGLPAEGRYRFVVADVLTAELHPLLTGADVVLHLAAVTDAASSFEQRDIVETVNYNATLRVAEACRDVGAPLIHLSSTSVYGTQRALVSEDCTPAELRPQSPYAETKLREEQFLQALGETTDLRFVTCRFGTICGVSPGMRFHTAVNKFCWQAIMGRPLTVYRTALHQKRPYLALTDAVEAVKFVVAKQLFDGRIYNVLTDNLTVQGIVTFIQQLVPKVQLKYVDAPIMNQLSYEVSNELFKGQGFEFRGRIQECIAETVALLGRANGV